MKHAKRLRRILREKHTQALRDEVIDFFVVYGYPDDEQLNQFAETIQTSSEDVREIIYGLLTEYVQFLRGGIWNEARKKDIDKGELVKGRLVEKEHTLDSAEGRLIAERIVLDHLAEIPDYYTRLARMENEAKGLRTNN